MHAPAVIPNTLCNVGPGTKHQKSMNAKPNTAMPSLILCAVEFFMVITVLYHPTLQM